jgi:hypothetical protein
MVRWVGVVMAVAALSAGAPPAAEAQVSGSADLAKADELYRRGVEAFEAQRLDDAYRLFLEAWGLKKGIDIAANLGVVELKLGKSRDAAEHLAYALRLFPANGDPEGRAKLLAKLEEAKKVVGTVNVRVDHPGAQIVVDGRDIGKSPIVDEVYVDPGDKVFTATLDRFETATAETHVDAGGVATVELKLVAKPDGGGGAGGGDPIEPPPDRPIWPLFVGGGVGLVGIGLGIGFFAMGENGASEAEAEGARLAEEGVDCGGGESLPEECSKVAGHVNDENNFKSASLTAFIIGGVALAATGVYGIVLATGGGDDVVETAKIQLVPIASPDTGGLLIQGSF